ncbi:ribbon-helix-helix protein, CopG family [Nocardia sp. NPDC006044]|uniref:type II toxin-antitoxin system VapB family antitoxin n=1 Tax=Nocardia sp. NPDC006044 TaxID=3364306 RepID=UPI003683EC65
MDTTALSLFSGTLPGDIFDIEEVGWMTDILIRDVPDSTIAEIDRRAKDLGVSRSEFLRRWIARDFRSTAAPVTAADLDRLGRLARDLGDSEVMRQAWS